MDKEFKLNSLLEITKAINSNLAEEKLYKLFEFVLNNQLKIEKATIFQLNEDEVVRVLHYGEEGQKIRISLQEDLLPVKDIKTITADQKLFEVGYQAIIPVYHNFEPKAFVLLGEPNLKTDFKVSPVVKNLRFIQTLANLIIVAIDNRRLNEQRIENVKMRNELELARQMQELLIPKELPSDKNFEVSAFYRAHSGVGGDYYDLVALSKTEYWFCVADICGKGISAALLMANLQANFRAAILQHTDLKKIIAQLNDRVFQTTRGERFITLFLGKIDFSASKIHYVNAGHPPALLKSKNIVKELEKGCPALGVVDYLPDIEVGRLGIQENTVLTVFTDGLTEAENENEKFFDEVNVIKHLKRWERGISMRDFNLELMEEVQDFMGEQTFTDDVAIMSFCFK